MSILINGLKMPQNIGRIVTIYPDGRVAEYTLMGERIVGNVVETTDVRPVVSGKWEFRNTDELISKAWTCSKCGRRKVFKTNFCPNCGADMREPQMFKNASQNADTDVMMPAT